jgi:hypothetical protein
MSTSYISSPLGACIAIAGQHYFTYVYLKLNSIKFSQTVVSTCDNISRFTVTQFTAGRVLSKIINKVRVCV